MMWPWPGPSVSRLRRTAAGGCGRLERRTRRDRAAARLPWALLGYSDPSSLTLYDEHPSGATTTLKGGRVGIGVLSDGSGLLTTTGFAWEPWQSVTWNERKKQGFDDLARTMEELSAPR